MSFTDKGASYMLRRLFVIKIFVEIDQVVINICDELDDHRVDYTVQNAVTLHHLHDHLKIKLNTYARYVD